MNVSVCNPLCRTPLSLIVDDSCPVLNLAPYWIEQRQEWRHRHHPGSPPEAGEGDAAKVASLPRAIPVEFAARWGDWCGEQGVRGKFSLIPFPAGVGRIDQGLEGFSQTELKNWLDVARDVIGPNFDLTPEMLTHTHVVNLQTGKLSDEWEQVEWVQPPLEPLTEYIIEAMQILKNAGIACEGVTSPGAFGKRREMDYARAVLDAALAVNANARPFYFLWLKDDEWPDVPLWHVEQERGVAIASIVSCAGDWFGGWTGYDEAGDPDLFITEDLQGGRLPPVLEKELPCVLVGHWPGFYFGGEEVGFDVLKEVKRRLDAFDGDGTRTLWMKNSEIGHYEMARRLSDISNGENQSAAEEIIEINSHFPTPRFTLSLDAKLRRVRVNGRDLRPVQSQRDFRSGTFRVQGRQTFIAFDLAAGRTEIKCEMHAHLTISPLGHDDIN